MNTPRIVPMVGALRIKPRMKGGDDDQPNLLSISPVSSDDLLLAAIAGTSEGVLGSLQVERHHLRATLRDISLTLRVRSDRAQGEQKKIKPFFMRVFLQIYSRRVPQATPLASRLPL